MDEQKKRLFFIRITCWLGIGADALWAVGLLFPRVYSILTGTPDFNPDVQVRLIMGIGGTLMTGWTFLLLWVLRRPVERRDVFLLTAFPVVFGLFVVALIGVLKGNDFEIWILIKCLILFIAMSISYVLASNMEKQMSSNSD